MLKYRRGFKIRPGVVNSPTCIFLVFLAQENYQKDGDIDFSTRLEMGIPLESGNQGAHFDMPTWRRRRGWRRHQCWVQALLGEVLDGGVVCTSST